MTISQDLQEAILENNPERITPEILGENFKGALQFSLECNRKNVSEYLTGELYQDRLLEVMHDDEDVLFRLTAKNENMGIVSDFIEFTPDAEKLSKMINSNNGEAFKSEKVATFLAVILGDEGRRPEISGPLNENKICKFREFKESLTAKIDTHLPPEKDQSNKRTVNFLVALFIGNDDLKSEIPQVAIAKLMGQSDQNTFFEEIEKILEKYDARSEDQNNETKSSEENLENTTGDLSNVQELKKFWEKNKGVEK